MVLMNSSLTAFFGLSKILFFVIAAALGELLQRELREIIHDLIELQKT